MNAMHFAKYATSMTENNKNTIETNENCLMSKRKCNAIQMALEHKA